MSKPKTKILLPTGPYHYAWSGGSGENVSVTRELSLIQTPVIRPKKGSRTGSRNDVFHYTAASTVLGPFAYDPRLGVCTQIAGSGYNYSKPHFRNAVYNYVIGYQHANSFNWEKSPFAGDFNILGFFAELDDTLAMFSKNFIKSLSYGAVEWGVKPFLADMQAMVAAASNAIKALEHLSSVPYEDEESFYSKREINNSNGLLYDIHATVRRTGTVDFSDMKLESFLDTIGFHADLALVWDLLPLSFWVDYIFPVGDILDNLWPRGWTRTVPFNGCTTVKAFGTADYAGSTYEFMKARNYHTLFQRTNGFTILTIPNQGRKEISLSMPSPKQIINSVYLANGFTTPGKEPAKLRKFLSRL
jgi:hypothetical protein